MARASGWLKSTIAGLSDTWFHYFLASARECGFDLNAVYHLLPNTFVFVGSPSRIYDNVKKNILLFYAPAGFALE